MTKIYLVTRWMDTCNYIVGAFRTEEAARAEVLVHAVKQLTDDRHYASTYTGGGYYITELPLHDHGPL